MPECECDELIPARKRIPSRRVPVRAGRSFRSLHRTVHGNAFRRLSGDRFPGFASSRAFAVVG